MGTDIDVLKQLRKLVQKGVTVEKKLIAQAIGAGGSVELWDPASGKKVLLKRFSISTDAATRLSLCWGSTEYESYYLPDNGSVGFNLIGSYIEGEANVILKVKSSAAVNICAYAAGDEV